MSKDSDEAASLTEPTPTFTNVPFEQGRTFFFFFKLSSSRKSSKPLDL